MKPQIFFLISFSNLLSQTRSGAKAPQPNPNIQLPHFLLLLFIGIFSRIRPLNVTLHFPPTNKTKRKKMFTNQKRQESGSYFPVAPTVTIPGNSVMVSKARRRETVPSHLIEIGEANVSRTHRFTAALSLRSCPKPHQLLFMNQLYLVTKS